MAIEMDELLARLQSNQDAEDPLAALLAEAESREPRLKLVRALLERRRRIAPEHSPELADNAATHVPWTDTRDPSRLVQAIADALAELTTLRERGQHLAAALGACPACWGVDARCRTCGGQGQPGAVMPDVARFRELVAPAVARLARAPEAEPLAPKPDAGPATARNQPARDASADGLRRASSGAGPPDSLRSESPASGEVNP